MKGSKKQHNLIILQRNYHETRTQMRNVNLIFLKLISREYCYMEQNTAIWSRILLYGAETWTTREDSKIQAWK